MPVAIDNQYDNDITIVGPTTDPGDDIYAQQDPPADTGWVAAAITAAPVMMASGNQATGKWALPADEMDIAESYTVYRNRHLATVEAYDGSTLLTITGHGITADSLVYARGGNMPGNVIAGKQYYLRAGDADTFELAATAGGAALSLGSLTGTLVMFITAASKRTSSDENIGPIVPDNTVSQLAAVVADTNELQADWTDGGRLDVILDAVKVDTDAIKLKTNLIGTSVAPLSSGGNGVEYATVGSTKEVGITCSADISAKTLVVVFEMQGGTDVATVTDGSLTKESALVTFSLPAASTTSERTLHYSVRDTTTSEEYAGGLLFVTQEAAVDA
jgi:hypothetical protein